MSATPPTLSLYLAAARLSEPLWRRLLSRRAAQGREDATRWREKLGRGMAPRPEGPVLWFHALSVGESLALLTLIRRLGAAHPQAQFLLTTTTRSSAEALDHVGLPPRTIHQFAPADAPGPLTRFLAHWRPMALVVAEFDLWPLTLLAVRRAGLPMLLINSRITDRRFVRRMKRRALYGHLLRHFDRILAQDGTSADRFAALGADPVRVSVMGVLKSAADPLRDMPQARAELAHRIGDRPVWLAAATERREEPLIAAAHDAARPACPGLLLIHAPRQTAAADAAEAAHHAHGLTVARRSRGEPITPATDVYLADTMGEMGLWFRLAPVTFIGHSLPVPEGEPLAGKNPFEALALDTYVLHGPDTSYFAESYAMLDAAGAAGSVTDAQSLARAVVAAQSPGARAAQTAAARAALAAAQAPLDAAIGATSPLLDATAPPLAPAPAES
ncbi:3-deoxy-D-manno-octulosonic acid transferase [Mesobaculum littorinae]|uniref:3-deoxy-D-manno-octulosonic acid transferase n=1 Tax=Mesobaculum littorinae TaxID=2486419 RepID=A0A438AJT7_9RHOB|nr:glycosyltransferase N-terminal domain-containing protein [Mesobaculum littorinae]RVV98980.1 3-deoxy-D-manno-octulosonic acid transferase [Mesobaculum littorinae]